MRSSKTVRLASCSCGQLTVRVRGEPSRVSLCHCLACQRRIGSVFGAQARFAHECIEPSGQSTTYVRFVEEGGHVRFHFCPRCGATVNYEPASLPDQVVIPVGAFADPDVPAPTVSVYEARRHHWVSPPAGAAHLD